MKTGFISLHSIDATSKGETRNDASRQNSTKGLPPVAEENKLQQTPVF